MFKLEKTPLAAAVKLAKNVVPPRNGIPALDCIELTGRDDGRVNLRVTDCETTLNLIVDGGQALPGESTRVNLQELTKAIGATDRGDSVTISGATYRAGSLTVNLESVSPDDYPDEVRPGSYGVNYSFDAPALRESLASMLTAVSNEEVRYYLGGVCIERSDTFAATLTATDGHRLLTEELDAFSSVENDVQEISHIMPKQACALIQALSDHDDVVTLAVHHAESGSRFLATGSDWQLSGRMIDGTFPDWRRVIPSAKSPGVAMFESKTAIAAIAKMCKLHKGSVAFDRDIGLESADGKIRVALPMHDLDHAPTLPRIGFDVTYLKPMIEALDGESTYISAESAESPTLWQPAESNRRIRGVLMPLRIPGAVSAAA